MKIQVYILVLTLLFITTACKKEKTSKTEEQVFEGAVVEYSTGRPIPNAAVTLFVSEGVAYTNSSAVLDRELKRSDLHFFNADSASATSDQNGKFRFKLLKNELHRKYLYFTERAGYISLFNPIIGRSLPSSNDTIFLDKPTYVKFHLRDRAPSSIDTLILYRYYYGSENLDIFPHTRFKSNFITNGVTNVTLVDTFSYQQFHKLSVVYKKNSSGRESILYIDLVPNGTKEVTIDF